MYGKRNLTRLRVDATRQLARKECVVGDGVVGGGVLMDLVEKQLFHNNQEDPGPQIEAEDFFLCRKKAFVWAQVHVRVFGKRNEWICCSGTPGQPVRVEREKIERERDEILSPGCVGDDDEYAGSESLIKDRTMWR